VTRILLADDQALVRGGFRLILDAEPDLEVVAEAADGGEAVELAAAARPDVALLDIRMPGLDGIEATRRLVAAQPETRVLILTTFDLDEYVVEAFRAGASGFLLKTAPPHQRVAAVRTVREGDALLAPASTRRLIQQAARPPAVAPALEELTAREHEVLRLLARGLSNKEIAQRLSISPKTVGNHAEHIYAKIDAQSRAAAAFFAMQQGLLPEEEFPAVVAA
jgi:DNA-binding NarL/FixJ family response regulator